MKASDYFVLGGVVCATNAAMVRNYDWPATMRVIDFKSRADGVECCVVDGGDRTITIYPGFLRLLHELNPAKVWQ